MSEDTALMPLSEWEATARVLRESAKARTEKKTPGRYIKKREGRGGQFFDYVQKNYLKAWLNDNFPGYSLESIGDPQVFLETAQGWGFISVHGRIRVIENGLPRWADGRGKKEVKFLASGPKKGQPLDLGNDIAAAETDSYKRAAQWLGFASDVYDPEEDAEPTEIQIARIEELCEHRVFTDIERFKIQKMVKNQEFTESSASKYIDRMESYIEEKEKENA